MKLLSIVAQNQGIDSQAAFQAWFEQEQLNDPNQFVPKLNRSLEALVGEAWLFDRSPFNSSP